MSAPAIETTIHDANGVVLRYRLKSTGGSSEKLGQCEVCNSHASDVFHLTGAILFERSAPYRETLGRFGWTHHQCVCIFGHAECLKMRRLGTLVMVVTDDRGDANFRAQINGADVLIGRDSEGFKVYIADRYEALYPTLTAAYLFATHAANHPEQRRPITRIE